MSACTPRCNAEERSHGRCYAKPRASTRGVATVDVQSRACHVTGGITKEKDYRASNLGRVCQPPQSGHLAEALKKGRSLRLFIIIDSTGRDRVDADLPLSVMLVFPDENHWILKGHNSNYWYGEVRGWLAHWLAEPPQV